MIKILVIDDKKSLSALLAQFLGKTYEVTTRENGLTALKWLQESNMPDLIITDLEMPEYGWFRVYTQNKRQWFFFRHTYNGFKLQRSVSADRIECLKEGSRRFYGKAF